MRTKWMYLWVVLLFGATAIAQSVSVKITSPEHKSRHPVCSTLSMAIDVQASGVEIKKVELYENGTLLKAFTKAPYTYSRKNLPEGIYAYYAKAIDGTNAETFSDTILVFIGNVTEGNLILNGQFNCSQWPWRLDQYVNAVASFSIVPTLGLTEDSSGAYIEITNVGDAPWAVQLMQPFKLQKGHTYEIRFFAEAPEPKEIEVAISQDYEPWQPHFSQRVTVFQADEYGPLVYECDVDDPKTMFKFVVGGNLIPISIDAVQVIDKMWTSVESKKGEQVTGYTLSPNYPNPFNAETTIRYTLPKNEWVTLSIYDVLGKNILSFSQQQSAGEHTFHWNGKEASGNPVQSGIYFFRLETKNYSQTCKMVLVK